MKQKIALLFFVLLLSSFSAYARLLLKQEGPKQGQNEVVIANTLVHTSHNDDELKDDIKELMGYENCDEKNEECYGRRMTLEAHLDYIYTQNVHHKP